MVLLTSVVYKDLGLEASTDSSDLQLSIDIGVKTLPPHEHVIGESSIVLVHIY